MDVDPMMVLEEDLGQPDVEMNLKSLRQLQTVGLVMGPDDCVDRLLPFLSKYCGFEGVDESKIVVLTPADRVSSDEALTEVAKQLRGFLPLVGGVGSTGCRMLLRLLQLLASAQETCIRQAAVESLLEMLPDLLISRDAIAHIMEIVQSLVMDEWFSCRSSAAYLIPPLLKALPQERIEDKTTLRVAYNRLCMDDTPMVRKPAFENLGDVAAAVGPVIFKSEFGGATQALKEETQESVRMYMVDTAVKLARSFPPETLKEQVEPLVRQCAVDVSWRIRKHLSSNIHELAGGLSRPVATKTLLPLFSKLLSDSESEVRMAAIRSLGLLAAKLEPEPFFKEIGPLLEGLTADPVNGCRVAFSEVVLDLCPVGGRQHTINHIIPLVLKMIDMDLPTLRGNVMEKLGMLIGIIGVEDVIKLLLPKVVEMAEDDKWRVRVSVLLHLGQLASVIGPDKFATNFATVFAAAYEDHVYAVRDVAAKQV